MTENIGTKGYIEVKEHFFSPVVCPDTGAVMKTVISKVGKVNYCSVQEGSFAATVDEPGGVLAVTTDTGDNDNCFLFIGPFKPADGGVWMETRFKVAAITTCALYAGFQETVNATTPVLPAEFATESFAYNASIGGFAGVMHDADATTDYWRYVGGDNSAPAWDADSTAACTPAPLQAPVADEFDVVRVEIDSHGGVDIYLAESAYSGSLRLLKHADSVVTPTDLTYAVLAVENRSAAANTLEVDYLNAGGYIDWNQ